MSKAIYDPGEAGFKLARSPFYLMAHADHKYHDDMDAVLAKRGMSKSIYRIMTVLRETEPASIGEITEDALLKRSTVSRIVDRMLESGFVVTAPAEEDARITQVSLTEAGHAQLREMTPIINRQFVRATQGIAEEELAQLVKTLQKIGENLSKSPIE
ncbi:MarR family winged helix-turn-helix transcriptional regulator [Altericroceibacterium endophyticum]|uniref:MarR family transcriptional regulator n=1 Tax=Altericroceibacterium endophyticum TaxID=1808508 RepID=A0A6I4T3W1_9SPHN|nr:MarR family transcriptional regulator [Altericroceibacterium endophyticum]MXO64952.1 MarR family transcriptional regulator [Altericroceibacterium endophyticum]